MRILPDENLPVQLKAVFPGHLVKSVNDSDVGWKNIKNGRLLAEMEGRLDLLVTADSNMFAQQNLSGRKICILVLPVNRRNDVLALSERIVVVARRFQRVRGDEYHIGRVRRLDLVRERFGQVQHKLDGGGGVATLGGRLTSMRLQRGIVAEQKERPCPAMPAGNPSVRTSSMASFPRIRLARPTDRLPALQ